MCGNRRSTRSTGFPDPCSSRSARWRRGSRRSRPAPRGDRSWSSARWAAAAPRPRSSCVSRAWSAHRISRVGSWRGSIRWIRSSRNTKARRRHGPGLSGRGSMRIAFQGAPGAYSEMAAQRAWPGAETVPCEQFEHVFASVAEGRSSHGLLPIENSIGGSIHRNYDLLLEQDLPIVAETELQVVHNLMALPGTELSQIRRVCSHPQALAQCESFLRGLPNVEIVATYDTAGSARLIRDQQLADTAAVASARAA